MTWMLVAAITFVILLLLAYEHVKPLDKKWSWSRTAKLPPGPQGLLVVGNLLQFWKARSDGSMNSYLLSLRSFGEMTTLHMGSHLWVLINSDRVANEIIAKRATITNQRPHMPISSGLISNSKRSVIQRSARWSEGRRLMRPLVSGPLTKTFTKWQDLESVQLLLSYIQEPTMCYQHNSRYATSVIYGVVAGHRLDKTEEELVEYRQVTMEFTGSLYSTIVDFFPVLDQIPRPLQLWRPRWEAVGQFHRRVFKQWWDSIKEKVEHGTTGDSWVRDFLLNPKIRFTGGEEEAFYLTNSVISAGGDNMRMALNTFVMASIHCPKAFQRCRQEIDKECGGSLRLPSVEDISSMPYLCAFIKETLRWRPFLPLIPPHQLTEESSYAGFIFPAQTNFIINNIAVCADCDQPDNFLPERWIGNAANLTHKFWGFGGGRRVCIGYKAVQPALFLAFSRLIYCFDFEPNGSFDSTRLNWSATNPFPVRVSKRSSAHEHLVWKEGAGRGLC